MIRKVAYFILTITFFLSLRFVAREYLPPPPLSQSNIELYEKTIIKSQDHHNWGDFSIWDGTDGFYSEITKPGSKDTPLSQGDKNAVVEIQQILDDTSTLSVRRIDNVMFFVKEPTLFLQRTPAYFYSPNGKDPIKNLNMIIVDDEDIYSLGGKWYAIKQITYVGGGTR